MTRSHASTQTDPANSSEPPVRPNASYESAFDASQLAWMPRTCAVAASRARWAHTVYDGVFESYRGVQTLVRNFNKRPEKWGASGDKSWAFLCQELEAPEASKPWSRAISSDGMLDGKSRDSDVLTLLIERATELALSSEEVRATHGLRMLAAVSADVPDVHARIRELLASGDSISPSLRDAAVHAASWCAREQRDFAALFAACGEHIADPKAIEALARLLSIREQAALQVPATLVLQWSNRIAATLPRGSRPDMDPAEALSAIRMLGGLLRARSAHPTLLEPGSATYSTCRGAALEADSVLASSEADLALTTRAALRRYVAFLDGKGHGDLIAMDASADLPPISEPPTASPMPKDDLPVTGPGTVFSPDAEQKRIVDAPSDAFLQVAAPPGAGKTAVACARIAALARQGVEPTTILMVSFTRVAVQEFRDRIQRLADDVPGIHGVEVTTLDSQSWHLLRGLVGSGDGEDLLGGYEQNIERMCESLRSGDPEVERWMQRYRHILVDEAQDLVGPRAELVALILNTRHAECGATLFADEAQAIYGFTDDQENKPASNGAMSSDAIRKSVLEILQSRDGEHATEGEESHTDEGRSFFDMLAKHDLHPERIELQRIHRTNNPNLKRLFLEARDPILASDLEGETQLAKTRQKILEHRDAEVDGRDHLVQICKRLGPLTLFRTRGEVLRFSSTLRHEEIPHRIRMSGTPQTVAPWVSFVLGSAEELPPMLQRARFAELWEELEEHPCLASCGHTADEAFETLLEVARKGPKVDLYRLRLLMARARPPVQLAQTETGTGQTILGTIHASKGREASEVVLALPREDRHGEDDSLDEEARVLYVGATRAVHRLHTMASTGSFTRKIDSGRTFWTSKTKKGTPAHWTEIGRAGDIDLHASVTQATHKTEEGCLRMQDWLARNASTDHEVSLYQIGKGDWSYRIALSETEVIGRMTQQFNSDLFEIGKVVTKSSSRPPKDIRHVTYCGATSAAVSADDPRLDELHERYARNGFFLAPVLRGVAPVFFFRKSTIKKAKW